MKPELLKRVIEAALMAMHEPLSVRQLTVLFEKESAPPSRDDVRAALTALQEDYAGHGVILKEVASGFRFQVHTDCAEWVNKLFDERPQRYSRALLETLAIIAYRQPLTRGE
ncbi:MAG: SMC-Scp complex subunit ScpB, partial [Gammaproteobacteria bacterium]